jgi:hypothetical protein
MKALAGHNSFPNIIVVSDIFQNGAGNKTSKIIFSIEG